MAAYAGYITQMDEQGVELRWEREDATTDRSTGP
jgi:hypothetical protein